MPTAEYAARFPQHRANGFFRETAGFTVSSLGIGTYLGAPDDAADRNYAEALDAAMRGGVNFIDTSLNYRAQRSERTIGQVLRSFRREEFVIATKAGYLVPGALPPADPRTLEIAANQHSMAPAFLKHQLETSLANLGAGPVDIFYLHNPETQLAHIPEPEFLLRIERAFAACEELAAASKLRYYGLATWSGFRKKPGEPGALSLERILECARRAGGAAHRFRFLQLPLNLGMCEALANSVLFQAEAAGLHVVASASLMQARLASGLPAEIGRRLPGPVTDAQRALQFSRSAPGVAVALAGMGRREHVLENLGLAGFPPATRAQFDSLFE